VAGRVACLQGCVSPSHPIPSQPPFFSHRRPCLPQRDPIPAPPAPTPRSEGDREEVLRLLRAQDALGAAVPVLARAGAGGAASPSESPRPAGAPPPPPPPSHDAAAALLDAGAGGWLRRVTLAWQQGRLTNFDYLLYLNLAAGRSFNDLAQWPVFPWVLADYTSAALDLSRPSSFRDLSKPMGAQTEARLADFRRRYKDMASLPPEMEVGTPFMYGTHYSTPG
jgi:hypothetical protein